MITTWDDALDQAPTKAGVYLLYDAVGNVAYVGQAGNVAKRLATHWAGNSEVGSYIKRHAPGSGAWRVEVIEGDKQVERDLIARHDPPFNQTLRNGSRLNRILTPPVIADWLEQLQAQFVQGGVDDYIERAVCLHQFGFILGTHLHKSRQRWHQKFHGDISLRHVFGTYFAQMLCGGDEWGYRIGVGAFDQAVVAFGEEVARVRAFCEQVPMPVPDEYGRLPWTGGRQVNARDVAKAAGDWPVEFTRSEDSGLAKPFDEWTRGVPLGMWRPDLGFRQPM